MMKSKWLVGSMLAGACVAAATGASATAQFTPIPATQVVKFSVYLPLQNQTALTALIKAQQTKGSPQFRKWLTPAQIQAQFLPTAATMATAKSALTAAGLTVTRTRAFGFDVSGTAGQVSKYLLTSLGSRPTSSGGTRVVSAGPVVIPAALAKLGARVPSFTPVPEHQPMSHKQAAIPANINGPVGDYNFDDLKQAYDYPAWTNTLPAPDGRRLDGTGVGVAFIMEGVALNSDITAMFEHSHWNALTSLPDPQINYVLVDGGSTFGSGFFSGEASLDAQMEIGGAPGATVTQIEVPDLNDQPLFDAYAVVIGEVCDQMGNCTIEGAPYDIVSNSYGECESLYLPAYNNGLDFSGDLLVETEFFEIGAIEGVTWLASSGDEDGVACPANSYLFGNPYAKFVPGVSTPSDDPYMTSVGGGNLITTYSPGDFDSIYVSENGYGDPEYPYDIYGLSYYLFNYAVNVYGGYWGAGGGVSSVFAQPPYQSVVNTGSTVARTQPDIGMMVGGCPGGLSIATADCPTYPKQSTTRSAVVITLGGVREGVIGTSVSSPEFAGALALLEESLSTNGVPGSGRVGIVNFGLYAAGAAQIAAGGASAPASSQYYHMNIPGYDGYYTVASGQGYNYIYGNGSPDVRKLFGFLYSGYSLTPAANPWPTTVPAGTPRTVVNP